MTNSPDNDRKHQTSTSFTVGTIALIFLAIGYQTALFIHKAAVATVVANHDHPDTVYVFGSPPDDDWPYDHGTTRTGSAQGGGSNARYHGTGNGRQYRSGNGRAPGGSGMAPGGNGRAPGGNGMALGGNGRAPEGNGRAPEGNGRAPGVVYRRKSSEHSDAARRIVQQFSERSYESFPFDPNTATVDELMRLGFSQKQAQSIDNYRQSGGRFRRKEDFAKSYVVADSVYQRLEQFISIPKLDINKADSTAFDSLPGIGGYYASRMVSYRKRLGGYSFPEQLMEITRFDQERYDKIKDLISLSPPDPYPLWTLPEDSLARHPYLDRHSAHSIVLFRDNSPRSQWTVEALLRNGILSGEKGQKLLRCRVAGAEE